MPAFDLANYKDVQQRIVEFWGKYPDGRIDTALMSLPDDFGQCRFRASVYKQKDDAHPSATGWAFEIAGTAGANRTSHEENAETSAIGRALANLGFAKTIEDRPSRQEMEKVNRGPVSQPGNAPARGAGVMKDLSPAPARVDVVEAQTRDLGITPEQQESIRGLKAGLGWTADSVRAFSQLETGKTDALTLTRAEADTLIAAMQRAQDKMLAMP